MIFCFTFFSYNGQRIFRLNKKILRKDNLSEHIQWVIQHKIGLTLSTVIFGLIGFLCTLFIDPYCYLLLIPIGSLSFFYVVPLTPIYKRSPTLRSIPYLKIIVIGITWCITIIWLPMLETRFSIGMASTSLLLSMVQVFLYVLAITLPFDIRDIKCDKVSHLKTIPQLIGIKNTLIFSELLLASSMLLIYFLPIGIYFYPLFLGHIITMIIIALTNEKRNEIFYAGWVEGTVIILYSSVIISDLFF